jgi:hypothetical protein
MGGGGMHVKLQCQMSQWLYQLQGYAKHNAHRHKKDMEYGGMNQGVGNPNGRHR